MEPVSSMATAITQNYNHPIPVLIGKVNLTQQADIRTSQHAVSCVQFSMSPPKCSESEGDEKEDWPVATPTDLDVSKRRLTTPDGPIVVCVVLFSFDFHV